MIFAAILAGGDGNRMGEIDKPKQFLKLGNKPIIIQTVEKFSLNSKIDEIIVLVHRYWLSHTKDLIDQYFPNSSNIVVIEAGELRNDTIMNAINHIEENFEIDENDKVDVNILLPNVWGKIYAAAADEFSGYLDAGEEVYIIDPETFELTKINNSLELWDYAMTQTQEEML